MEFKWKWVFSDTSTETMFLERTGKGNERYINSNDGKLSLSLKEDVIKRNKRIPITRCGFP